MASGKSIAAALSALAICAFTAAPLLAGDASDGRKLYAGYCADCHGPLDKSDVRGAKLDEIKYAMTDRMCGEAGGSRLTGAQLETLARVLSGKTR